MPYARRVKVKAQSVCYRVERGCLALCQLRYLVGTLRNFPHREAEAGAAVSEHLARGLVLIGECVLVVCKVNPVVIRRKLEHFPVRLGLLHNNAPEKFCPVITEYALVPLFHVDFAPGVFVPVVVNQRDGKCAGGGAFSAFPAYLFDKL